MDALEYCLGIPDPADRKAVISALSLSGLSCVGDGSDCQQFLRMVRKVQPQLAVLELSLPGNVLETASIIDQEGLAALLLLEGKRNRNYSIALNDYAHVMLKLPLQAAALNSVIEVLYLEFKKRQKLQQEIFSLRAKLQTRTTVERAKGVIMKEFAFSEEQAYRFLRKKSMDLRLPLKDVAERILQGTGGKAK